MGCLNENWKCDQAFQDDGEDCDFCIVSKNIYNYSEITNDYFHGDFDLKKLIQKIGKDTIQKVLNDV